MSDSPTPLVTAAEITQGAFANLVESYSSNALNQLLIEATRACETECGRRLAPFVGVTETHQAYGLNPDEYTDAANLPLDIQGSLGMSYARSLGASTLVRHCWLNECATQYPEYWSYSDLSVEIIRSYGGSQILQPSQYIGPELDSGHMWFNLGLFIPLASMIRVTYSGGYTTVPADLRRACIWMAASIVTTELDPNMVTHGHTADDLETKAVSWLSPYMRS